MFRLLGEGVAELGGVDEVLKALGEFGIVRSALRKRRNGDRIIIDKSGLDEVCLDKFIEESREDIALGAGVFIIMDVLCLCGGLRWSGK